MKKIGIFGGSFDPIHFGHLILAEQVRVEAGLSRVVFMPACVSPFKQGRKVVSPEERLEMVRLAVQSNPYFSVSDMEIQKQGVSYTAETLRQYRSEAEEETEICFITGTDAFLGIADWRESEYLLSHFSFAIGLRPGFREEELDRFIEEIHQRHGTNVMKVYSSQVDISSSHIRELMEGGRSPRYLLPDSVLDYIRREGLYQPQFEETKDGGENASQIRTRISDYIEANLKPSRYRHTLGVVREAVSLAKTYGADPVKAELCALFHDSCRSEGNLVHGKRAAELMKQDYNIQDQDMINAVEFHTTGREGMSLLEKILYLADAIEPSRDYPGVGELRRMAYEDLDGACLSAMERSIAYVMERGFQLDENTVKARDDINRKIKNNEKRREDG